MLECLVMAIPFWICWTYCGLGEFYFGPYLPDRFASIPFWHTFGLFVVAGILRKLVPSLADVRTKRKISLKKDSLRVLKRSLRLK